MAEDFEQILTHSREKIAEKAIPYETLYQIFSDIEGTSNDRNLYNLLSGFQTKYFKSNINTIYSEELVDGLISLAKESGITSIEEIYAGMGILSSMLQKRSSGLKITASDLMLDNNCCEPLDLIPIAKRDPDDFRYYPELQEPFPEMIISSYYPKANNDLFIQKISNLVKSNNHKVIVILLPYDFISLYDSFYHIEISNLYKVRTYHVKALDKYFAVFDLIRDSYKTPIMAHVLVKDRNLKVKSAMKSAIVESVSIDRHCYMVKWLNLFYNKFSKQLISSIYHELILPTYQDYSLYKTFINFTSTYVQILKVDAVPHYIYDVNEFLFWYKCFSRKLYFLFDSRAKFIDFHERCRTIDKVGRDGNLPGWLIDSNSKYIYIYLSVLEAEGRWGDSIIELQKVFKMINNQNQKKLFAHSS